MINARYIVVEIPESPAAKNYVGFNRISVI